MGKNALIILLLILPITSYNFNVRMRNFKIIPNETPADTAYRVIKYWEGGVSSHSSDIASKGIPAELNGVHTINGVTWATFKSCADSVLKREPTPKNFLALTDADVKAIFTANYWRYYGIDKIKHRRVAIFSADFAFNAGRNAVIQLQIAVNKCNKNAKLIADGILGEFTAKAVNECNEDILLEYYSNQRMGFYNYLASVDSSQKVFLNGWRNRTEQVYFLMKKI